MNPLRMHERFGGGTAFERKGGSTVEGYEMVGGWHDPLFLSEVIIAPSYEMGW